MSSIVSKKFEFVYTHIPRTGGTSWTDFIRRHDPEMQEYPHYPLSELPKDYFKFSIIRNPFDRAVSLFARTAGMWEHDFLRFLKEPYDWKRRETFCPAEVYLCDADGNKLFDELFRFEDNPGRQLCERFGVEQIDYPHWSKTNHGPREDYFSKEAKEIVELRCAWEIKWL